MTNLEELRGRIAAVREEIRTETAELKDSKAVYEIKKAFLDKTGRIGQLMRYMKDVDPSQRAEFGKNVNALKKGDSLKTILANGVLMSEVEEIINNKEEQ